jgi:transposase
MLNDAAGIGNIYITCGYTDLRYGIDGLSTLVKSKFELDPFQTNTLFLFCGRKKDRLKGLLWEGDGFLLLYKRLEAGKFRWPRNADEVKKMTSQQYRWLMEGLAIEPQKVVQNPTPTYTA